MTAPPGVGISYRHGIDDFIRANLARFGVLEITLDHCLGGNAASRAAIFDLVGQIPLTAHGRFGSKASRRLCAQTVR
jgi:hypothetical protein